MDTLLWWLVQNAIVVALALPVVWLVARWRSLRPAEQHWLWLLLLVKLATPPLGTWPVSLSELHDRLLPRAVLEPPANVTPPVVETASLDAIPIDDEFGPVYVDPAERESVGDSGGLKSRLHLETFVTREHTESPAQADLAGIIIPWLVPAAITIWLGGAAVMLVVTANRLRRQWRLLQTATVAPAVLERLVERVAARLGMDSVPVCISDAVASPCISCLGRARLIWPSRLADVCTPGLDSVIAHELAHVRRRDHWVSWLELAVGIVWWWHPAAWFIRARLHETRELACDALSLEGHPADRRRYAELLLQLSQGMSGAWSPAPLGAGFGVVAHHSLRRRLQMVFQDRVSGRTSLAGIALAALLAVAALPGWALSQDKDPPVDEEKPQPKDEKVEADPKPKPVPKPPVDVKKEKIEVEFIEPKVDPPKGVPVDKKHADKTPVEGDSDVVQEIPVEGKVSKIQVRQTKDGLLIIEVVGAEGKTQTVLKMAPHPIPKATVRRQGAKTVTEDGKLIIVEDSDEGVRKTIDAASGKILKVEEFSKSAPDAKPTIKKSPTDHPYEKKLDPGEKIKSYEEAYKAGVKVPHPPELHAYPPHPKTSVSPEDVELAEIKLQEMQLELEQANEDAHGSKDPKLQRKVKLAELAVRRAKIELSRLQGNVKEVKDKK